jgi:hypothetical protein
VTEDQSIDVFVSRPRWVAPEFQAGLTGFLRMLVTLNLVPRTLGKSDYGRRAPLDDVIEVLDQCRGAVILGYPQIKILSGELKGAVLNNEVLLATEWNHIEAGLARARGLPLLVIHHTGVERGIFDRGATSSFLYEKDLSLADWPLTEDIQGALVGWRRDCFSP